MAEGAQLATTSMPSLAIILRSKTAIRLRHIEQEIRLPCAWEGVVVDDDASERTMKILLPGFGICTIDRTALPKKRTRAGSRMAPTRDIGPATRAQLRHLLLNVVTFREEIRDRNDSLLVSRILALVGRNLTALKISCDGFDSEVVVNGLANCPHLHTLDVDVGEHVTALDLLPLYDQGMRISSLDIASISTQSLESLLDVLTARSTHPIYRTLKKLRLRELARATIQASTMQKLIQVARENRLLSHVDVYRSWQDSELPWSELASCDGQVEVQVEHFPMASRYASLSALQHLSTCSDAFQLHTDAIALIFGFAAPTQPRLVRVENKHVNLKWW